MSGYVSDNASQAVDLRDGQRGMRPSPAGLMSRCRLAWILVLLLPLLLVACAGQALSSSPADLPPPDAQEVPGAEAEGVATPGLGPLPDSEGVGPGEPLDAVEGVHPLVGVIAGHGGAESGAVHRDDQGRVDLMEKDLTLAIAQRLRELLRARGLGVVMDREGDVAVAVPGDDRNDDGRVDDADEIQSRLDILNGAAADLLVSVHFNGFGSPSVRGTTTYFCSDRPFAAESKRLATLVHQALVQNLEAAGADVQDRGVQDDSVLGKPYGHLMTLGPETPRIPRPGNMPGVLVEPLFLTNDYEAGLLQDPAVLESIAQGLARGIQAYLAPPPTPTPAPTATPVPRPQAAAPMAATATEVVRGPAVPRVAFTFDLGSGASRLPAILDSLSRHGIKATFFYTGQWIDANPEMTVRILKEGHEPGNHSYTHPDFRTISDQKIIEELARTDSALQRTAGRSTKPWFRPPFGGRDKRTLAQVSQQGYRNIYWTLDSGDWRTEFAAATVRDRVIQQSTPGAIVVMHGDSPQTAETLDAMITGLRARGLEPVPLSALLGQ